MNCVEFFAKKNSGDGIRRELRRRRTVQLVMKGKLEDAVLELRWTKEKFVVKMNKVERRWGHHRDVLVEFRNILKREATRVWVEGKEKNTKKIDHLTKKWRRRKDCQVENGEWRGIKIGDRQLEEEMREENDDYRPHKYGGVGTNPNEDSILALPHKFTTFENIQIDKIRVYTVIMKDKVRWELRCRQERDGEPWTEEWEMRQQEKKEVYRPVERRMEFSRRRVTDMPTNRNIYIPEPAEQDVETVFDNISSKVTAVAIDYIRTKCDKKAILRKEI